MIDVERIKERMAALGLNPNSTSEQAGLGRDYVRDILRGRIREPSALRLSKLADVLQCTPEYLQGIDNGSWEHLPDADDRDAALPESARKISRALAEESSNVRAPFFDLLDSVEDHTFLEMVFRTIFISLSMSISNKLGLSDAERVVLFDPKEAVGERDLARASILAKSLGLSSPEMTTNHLCLAKFWAATKGAGGSDIFRRPSFVEMLMPILKEKQLDDTPSREAIRLALVTLVAELLGSPFDSDGEGASG